MLKRECFSTAVFITTISVLSVVIYQQQQAIEILNANQKATITELGILKDLYRPTVELQQVQQEILLEQAKASALIDHLSKQVRRLQAQPAALPKPNLAAVQPHSRPPF